METQTSGYYHIFTVDHQVTEFKGTIETDASTLPETYLIFFSRQTGEELYTKV